MLLPETPAHSRARLAQFLVGTLLLLLAPGEHKALFVPLPDTQVEKSVVVLKLPYLQKNFFRKIILQFVDYGLGHFLVG